MLKMFCKIFCNENKVWYKSEIMLVLWLWQYSPDIYFQKNNYLEHKLHKINRTIKMQLHKVI